MNSNRLTVSSNRLCILESVTLSLCQVEVYALSPSNKLAEPSPAKDSNFERTLLFLFIQEVTLMDRDKSQRYVGSASCQGVDAPSDLLGGMSLPSQLGRRITPVSLGKQSTFLCIAESMKEMVAKHNDVQKQRVQLPLKTSFIDTVRSAGFPYPEFSYLERRGYFKVTIDMVVDSKNTSIQGDLCATQELAEISAINQALINLKRFRNVVLVDISARKAKAAIFSSREFYFKGCDGLRHIDYMIKQWLRSLDNIELVVSFAEDYLQTENDVQRKFADSVHTSLLIIKGGSAIQIGNLNERIMDLRAEKDKYVACSRAEPMFRPPYPKKKVYYQDVDALAHLLQCLKLKDCVYSSEADDNDLYLGAAQLNFGDNGGSIIWAKHYKSTIAKAHNAAAREAIFYLEDKYKVDVGGYNHDATILAEQETFVWKGLYEEIFKLADDVLLSWEDMLKRLGGEIERRKNAQVVLAQRCTVDSVHHFIEDLIGRIELALGKCTETFNLASSKLLSLK